MNVAAPEIIVPGELTLRSCAGLGRRPSAVAVEIDPAAAARSCASASWCGAPPMATRRLRRQHRLRQARLHIATIAREDLGACCN
jgi:hypothetical protein